MPVQISYNLPAVLCPAIVTPSSLLNPGASPPSPTTASTVTAGNSGSGSLSTPFNSNAVRLDVIGRRGGGGYAITEGLALSDSGLTLNVAVGQAMIDGPATVPIALAEALSPNTYYWIWLLTTGGLSPVAALRDSPVPAAPAARCAYLGRVRTGASIQEIDCSRVMYLRGGSLWCRTGDEAAPQDTPPSDIQFFCRTRGGLYYWDGSQYDKVGASTASLVADLTAAESRIDDLERVVRRLLVNLYGEIELDLPAHGCAAPLIEREFNLGLSEL